jgi:hypothetical protein
MGASAVSMQAMPVSRDRRNADYHLVDDAASDDRSTRSQLIETIKTKVMSWTKWKPAVAGAGVPPVDSSDELRFGAELGGT